MMGSMANNVELVLDAHSIVGEGAIWDEKRQVLYWVDIDQGLVHVYDPTTGKDRSIQVGQAVGTLVPRTSGGLMLAVRDGFMFRVVAIIVFLPFHRSTDTCG
jgi:L-arabinonolactonase